MNSSRDPELFDAYARDYESSLNRGISVSGEGRDYFARGRIEWLARGLRKLGASVGSVMDFGCGTGDATPHIVSLLNAARVIGVDLSLQSLRAAADKYGSERVRFALASEFTPAADMDLVFCNGVFHHVPPAVRAEKIRWIFDCLRLGGLFAFWDNNPWSLGARLVMKRIPFDRDAVMVWPSEARHHLRASGFEIVRTDYQFIFPHALRFLRKLEVSLACLPLGAQYQVLARKLA